MNTTSPYIREAQLADAEALAKCIDAAYAKYADRISDLPPVSEGCAEEITNNQVWVAVDAGTIVAGLVLIPKTAFMKVANLAVHPDYGGKGLGGKLMDISEREALRQGFKEMRLSTHCQMPENIQLYTHLGWQEISRAGNTISMRKFICCQ
ncbi:GNAT family N-acetyltransferase [Sneathiella marina]|uniref:GNAT family N-acetyltransferase n=1 Tax=Sneathiella marina TaxID=2950108 RepID=A0ABY4W038_9PROT|nr:GNAT family N-acetyltransferase [Sneathiella marina]USG60324.1 GNAT family N-acetyltransferase [Sneathiella marina]